MNMIEEARLADGGGKAGGRGQAGEAVSPCTNSSTNGTGAQGWICEFLHVGAEHAVTAGELAALLHVRRRTISLSIERARRAGYPILASCDTLSKAGYFLPASKGEFDRYLQTLRHRTGEVLKTLAAMEAAAEEWNAEGGGDGEICI